MNVATFTREMTLRRPTNLRGFTLIELLMVIAIMAVLAGLLVGLNNVAGDKKKISRAQVERDRLITLIEAYKLKLGVYPPQNPDPNNAEKNTLLYELAGAYRDMSNPGNPLYQTPFGDIRSNLLYQEFGISGLVNASDDRTEIKRFLKAVKPDQVASLVPGTLSLVVPIDRPDRSRPNPWKYFWNTNTIKGSTTNILHNPDAFDLWAEIYSRGKKSVYCTDCVVIGNWKD